MEQFFIAESYIGGERKEITLEEFGSLRTARDVASTFAEIEQSLDLVGRAILELEEYLLLAALNHWLSPAHLDDPNRSFLSTRSKLNLKIISILSSFRGYDDISCKAISHLQDLGGPELLASFKKSLGAAYDSDLSYRIICQLRNHAQHQSLPLGLISFPSKWLHRSEIFDANAPRRIRYSADVYISTNEIVASSKIKKGLKDEVLALEKRNLDLKYIVRSFAATLASAHESFYREAANYFRPAIEQLRCAASELSKKKGSPAKFTSLFRYCEGVFQEELHLNFEYFERALPEVSRWSCLKGMKFAFISSEITRNRESFPVDDLELWISD